MLAWLPASRAALVIEVKTVLVDLQDLLSTLDRKKRLAPSIAREAGWKPLLIGTLLVMPAETQARTTIERYRPLFGASYPARGRQVQQWLRSPEHAFGGIWFVLNFTADDTKRRPGGSFRVRPARGALPVADPRSEAVEPTGSMPGSRPSAGVGRT